MEEKFNELRKNTDEAEHYFSRQLAFTIGPVELKHLLDKENVKLIDVRRREDYDIGHIPSAISIPKDEITENFEKLSKDDTNIVYCYNQQCHLGARAALLLAEYEYPVVLLEGGFRVWTEDFRFATVSEQ